MDTTPYELAAVLELAIHPAAVTYIEEYPPVKGLPQYATGLFGTRLVESTDGGRTWRFWTGE
jgi:hypothetical protein